MIKKRLDEILVERGLADSLKKAGSMIMAGTIYISTKQKAKAGEMVSIDSDIIVKSAKSHHWASRGGLKLEHAIKYFNLYPAGQTAIDIGCSTGGFSDVLLSYNAASIFAVDVGYGEFDYRLRQDPRITLLERTNARYLTIKEIPTPPEFIVCDASFISLTSILPATLALAAPNAKLIALIKPQFEVEKEQVEAGGIIKSTILHEQVTRKIEDWLTAIGWQVLGITDSPVLGAKGNREFLIGAVNGHIPSL